MSHQQPIELQSLLRAFDEDMTESPKLEHDAGSDHGNAKVDDGLLLRGTADPEYEGKAHVLNRAIQDIGMGWYQWQLFVVVGFGWASDNLWPIASSLILPAVTAEFKPRHPPLLTLCQSIGLLFGAMFWGFGCDLFGRRIAFNLTIGITSIFGLAGAGAPSFAAIGVFSALWSAGVGGNLPVGKSCRHPSSKRG
jgi:hypothetical protein